MKVKSLEGEWLLGEKEVPVPSLFVSKATFEKYFSSLRGNEREFVGVVPGDSFTLQKKVKLSKEELSNEKCVLHFDRLDTLCNVFVNSKKVAFCKNCHRSYDFDVKDLLIEGTNYITVSFLSLEKYIAEKQKKLPLPFNQMGIKNHPHVRKPAFSFGWDFTAPLCAQGISAPAQLRFFSHPVITSFDVRQKIGGKGAVISLSAETDREASLIFTLTRPDGVKEKVHADENLKAEFEIENPEFWYCNTMGAQPLYSVSAEVISDGGTVLDKKKKKIGLRTVFLDRKQDRFGNNFQFFINGEPIFAKGANYIPIHMLYTCADKKRLRALLTECKRANMNMLRVWGGGFYESDDFYSLCDELGLLVWQDCSFACCAYPFMDEEFLNEVKSEIRENVARLRHHPSLCLWCGNNEIESISPAWIYKRDFINSTKEFFYQTLPSLLSSIDGETPYHECSPGSGTYMKEPSSDKNGDAHIWNTWHGFRLKDYYKKRFPRFCSEVGMESYPGKTVASNQFCTLGDERLDFYLAKHFKFSKDENERRYLTGLLQLEYMKEAAEHFRRNGERCHGFLFWQLNDCWESLSWAAIDVEGQKKALMYSSKHFYENVHISCVEQDNEAQIHVTNENRTAFSGKAEVFFESTVSGRQGTAERRVCVREFSDECVLNISLSGVKKTESVLIMRLFDENNELVSENRAIFCENNELILPRPELKVTSSLRAGRVFVTVTAEKYARYIELSNDSNNGSFSENYFDLCAGESKTIEVFDSFAEPTEHLLVTSLYDFLKSRDKRADKKVLRKIYMNPEVSANFIARIIGD